MKIVDTREGSLAYGYRRVLVPDYSGIVIVGPTPKSRNVCMVATPIGLGSVEIIHPDLIAHFDRGMAVGPWLDWAAEVDPAAQPFADLFGRLMSETPA